MFARKIHPRPDETIRKALLIEIGDMRQPQADGVDFIRFYIAEAKKKSEVKEYVETMVEESIRDRIIYRMTHHFGGKPVDHETEVHYHAAPANFVSVRYRFIENDYFHLPVREVFNLDFAPDPIPLIRTPVAPAPEAAHSQKPESVQAPAKPKPIGKQLAEADTKARKKPVP